LSRLNVPNTETRRRQYSCWWERVVQEVCRASDLAEIRNVLRLLPAPNDAAALLSRGGERWLTTSLHVICEAEAIEVPAWNSLESVAQAIVDIITRRRCLSPWNVDWIISDLKGSTDLSEIAAKFDSQIHQIFSETTLSDWVAWYLGHPNGNTNFLESALDLRNGLVGFARSYGIKRLTCLLEALPSQQPLPHGILSTAISSDTSSNFSIPLRTIAEPIEQLFTKQRYNFAVLVQQLMILETRFNLKRDSFVVNWSEPLSVDFSIWRGISRKTTQMLVESTTQGVEKLFAGISVEHLHWADERVKYIGQD